jgi:hypothetical protein
MNQIDEIVKYAFAIMIVSMLGVFIYRLASPKKESTFIDVSRKTPRELLESEVTLEDIIRSVQKVESKL